MSHPGGRTRNLRLVFVLFAAAVCVTVIIVDQYTTWRKGHDSVMTNRHRPEFLRPPLLSNLPGIPPPVNFDAHQSHQILSLHQSKVAVASRHFHQSLSPNEPQESVSSKTCQRRRHIGFIKIHKAGSSTVSNILFRFGMANNLTFVLPRDGVFVSLMQTSPWTNILPPPPGKRYDILCSHDVFVKAEVTKVLPADTVYAAIIRHPLSHLRSVVYYFYKTHIPGPRKVKKFLKNPHFFSNLQFQNLRSFTNNSMSYELGLSPEDFFDKTRVLTFLERLDAEFGLVLIMERMDESLVLLRRYMCWELRDILYVKRNVNILKPDEENITDSLRQKHTQIDMADYMLYDHFSKRLQDKINKEGKDFVEETNVFKTTLEQVRQLCFGLNWPRRSHVHVPKTKWNSSFNVSFEDCKLYLFNGNEILNYVKRYQYPGQF